MPVSDGWRNLRPLDTVSPEEAFAIRSAGGKARAEASHRQKSLRALTNALCACEVPDGPIKEQLEALGLPTTMGQAMIYAQAAKAVQMGDTSAFIALRDTKGEKPGLEITAIEGKSVSELNLDELTDEQLRGLIADASAAENE